MPSPLCYFGLLSEDESISRVKLRSQTGGHDVTDEVIRFNFNEGLAKSNRTYTCLKISTSSMAFQNMGELLPCTLRKDIFIEWRTILPFGSGSSLKRLLTDFPSNRYKRKRLTAGLALCVWQAILYPSAQFRLTDIRTPFLSGFLGHTICGIP